jgi:hypothetical protein
MILPLLRFVVIGLSGIRLRIRDSRKPAPRRAMRLLPELLFTPGRVTLTNEQGLVRRIYTEGQVAPADAEPANTGISIGHWERQTLVVETTHINPRARYPLPQLRMPPIGANARITERIFLEDPDTLQIDVVVVAPDALTEPDRRTRIFRRLAKTLPTEFTHCAGYDPECPLFEHRAR